jgi:heme oxygenase
MASLKRHTEDLHRRVEAAVDIVGRTRTAGEYGALLARLYGFYEPFERRLGAVEGLDDLGLDLAARRKAPLLAADLAGLGYGSGDLAALPRCAGLPGPRTVAEAVGCLYVLEGATLGGRFIRRQVERALGSSGVGSAFFSSYGEDVGRMWAAFGAAAESAVITEEGRSVARGFAASTFEAFEAWVAPRGGEGSER